MHASSRWFTAGAIATAIGMLIGELGPWVTTPVITFSGWAGLGLPLAIVGVLAVVFLVLHAVMRRRSWLVLVIVLAALTLISAIAIWLLESLLSRAGSLLALVVARGTHRDLFGTGHPVSLSWGVPLMAVSAGLLLVFCVAGLFGHYPVPALPAFARRRGASSGAGTALEHAARESASDLEDESSWFSTQ